MPKGIQAKPRCCVHRYTVLTRLFVCLSICFSVCLFVCLPVCLFVCLSVSPNICFLDINECLEQSGLCQYTCQNTAGSFQCLCPRGTRLDTDNFTCLRKYKLFYCNLRIHLTTLPRSFAFFPYYNAYLNCNMTTEFVAQN